jgi:hypothetical protein
MKNSSGVSIFLYRCFVRVLIVFCSFFSVFAAAGSLDLGGDLHSQVEVQGTIVNLGVSGGGHIETEVSIGSTHQDLKIPGEYSSDIHINGASSDISVLNTALSEGGDGTCAKVSIGSIAPGTCDSYKGQ